jgi:cytosine/uracil/thiamine/allantoin permease
VDYWILRRRRYSTRDLVVPRGGAYWYLGGVNPLAVGSFVVGAALAFYWTRVSPLPFGATHSSDLRGHLRALPRAEPAARLEGETTR